MKILKENYNDKFKIIIIGKGTDGMNHLSDMIKYIGEIGNTGHSFDILVDPDVKDYSKLFAWDGDGADYIDTVKIEKIGENNESNKK
jgi:hypothetical protein